MCCCCGDSLAPSSAALCCLSCAAAWAVAEAVGLTSWLPLAEEPCAVLLWAETATDETATDETDLLLSPLSLIHQLALQSTAAAAAAAAIVAIVVAFLCHLLNDAQRGAQHMWYPLISHLADVAHCDRTTVHAVRRF